MKALSGCYLLYILKKDFNFSNIRNGVQYLYFLVFKEYKKIKPFIEYIKKNLNKD